MSDNSHDCDAVLHEYLDVVDIPNIKLLKKKAKKFNKDLCKLFCEKNDLIAKLNEFNKLVKKFKKLAEIFLKLFSLFLQEFDVRNINNIHRFK